MLAAALTYGVLSSTNVHRRGQGRRAEQKRQAYWCRKLQAKPGVCQNVQHVPMRQLQGKMAQIPLQQAAIQKIAQLGAAVFLIGLICSNSAHYHCK
jgi:hypothetical protein